MKTNVKKALTILLAVILIMAAVPTGIMATEYANEPGVDLLSNAIILCENCQRCPVCDNITCTSTACENIELECCSCCRVCENDIEECICCPADGCTGTICPECGHCSECGVGVCCPEPPLSPSINLSVTKVWDCDCDPDDHDPIEVQEVATRIISNDDGTETRIASHGRVRTLAAPNWTNTFNGVPTIMEGDRVEWSVRELDVPEDYRASVSSPVIIRGTPNDTLAFTITNTDDFIEPVVPVIPVNKQLFMPQGTIVPEAEFKFDVTFISVDPPLPVRAPSPTTWYETIGFTLGENHDNATGTVWDVAGQTNITFDNMTWVGPPGIYTFRVTERPNESGVSSPGIVIYDPNVFYIDLAVGWVCGGTEFEELDIFGYGVYHWNCTGDCTHFQSTPNCTTCARTKFTSTCEIEFDNYYLTRGPLYVHKFVGGNFGNMLNPFDMSITLTMPPMLPANQRYPAVPLQAQILRNGEDEWGAPFNISANGTANPDNLTFVFSYTNTPNSFRLRHNDQIRFLNVPYGSTYTFTEYREFGYYQSARVTIAGVQGEIVNQPNHRSDLIVSGRVEQRWYRANIVDDNNVRVSNIRNTQPPMGIFASNVPFVIMLSVAGLAFVGFIWTNAKKKNEEEY